MRRNENINSTFSSILRNENFANIWTGKNTRKEPKGKKPTKHKVRYLFFVNRRIYPIPVKNI
jgi:hypothetical protein